MSQLVQVVEVVEQDAQGELQEKVTGEIEEDDAIISPLPVKNLREKD